jgi:hypothetical protein
MAGLWTLSLGMSIAKHGQPRDPENAWITLTAIILSATILYFGNFWSNIL